MDQVRREAAHKLEPALAWNGCMGRAEEVWGFLPQLLLGILALETGHSGLRALWMDEVKNTAVLTAFTTGVYEEANIVSSCFSTLDVSEQGAAQSWINRGCNLWCKTLPLRMGERLP